jgi:hypothetical protein
VEKELKLHLNKVNHLMNGLKQNHILSHDFYATIISNIAQDKYNVHRDHISVYYTHSPALLLPGFFSDLRINKLATLFPICDVNVNLHPSLCPNLCYLCPLNWIQYSYTHHWCNIPVLLQIAVHFTLTGSADKFCVVVGW